MTPDELVTVFDSAGIAVIFVGLIIFCVPIINLTLFMSRVPQILFTSLMIVMVD
jgi:hypothetical protein